MITPIGSNPALTERSLPNVFRFTNRDDNTARAMATYLWERLGKRRTAIFGKPVCVRKEYDGVLRACIRGARG